MLRDDISELAGNRALMPVTRFTESSAIFTYEKFMHHPGQVDKIKYPCPEQRDWYILRSEVDMSFETT
jgi:hypothetical protein